MNVVYFDCFAGAAGDMLLGSLLDAGAPEEDVRAQLKALDLEGWELRISQVVKQDVRATKVDVAVTDPAGQRSYRDIVAIIDRAGLHAEVAARSLRCFEILAGAEARVHGVGIEEVHLHEAGALDAIVDVVGSCAALQYFLPARVVASPLPTGSGTIVAAHGTLPVPAPAVAEILSAHGIPVFTRGEGEVVTPTGAALLAGMADVFGPMPDMRMRAVGYGAGTRDQADVSNVVRTVVGEAADDEPGRDALVIETNVDDMSPELLPHVIDSLLRAGASDAWITPIVMKKGRPAFKVSVLADPARRSDLVHVLFRETSTLGLRTWQVEKEALRRSEVTVDVHGASVRVKIATRDDDIVTVAPEYDDARVAAQKTGLPLKTVYELATAAARESSGQ